MMLNLMYCEKTGIAEHISSSDVLTKQQQGSDLKQIFTSISAVEISGAILNDTILPGPSPYIDKFGNTVYTVIIDAEVIKYEHSLTEHLNLKLKGCEKLTKMAICCDFHFYPKHRDI